LPTHHTASALSDLLFSAGSAAAVYGRSMPESGFSIPGACSMLLPQPSVSACLFAENSLMSYIGLNMSYLLVFYPETKKGE